MRESHRIFENLGYLREVIIAQQNALADQRARLARGRELEEEYPAGSDDYRGGGYTGGDAKKRRGVSFESPSCCYVTNFNRRLLRLGDVTAATVLKRQNGDEAPMERAHCATPVVYTMRSLLEKWASTRHLLSDRIYVPNTSIRPDLNLCSRRIPSRRKATKVTNLFAGT